jgi:hypothetical protein
MSHSTFIKPLQKSNPVYYGKILTLRQKISDWLAYIPATFPHYTQHTVAHSDEILSQIQRLLAKDDRSNGLVVALSPTERFILATAAYLHDAGMVASDSEKAEILKSEKWEAWVGDERIAPRWAEILLLRKNAGEDTGKIFLADVQMRFLLAEYLRRDHHVRSGKLVLALNDYIGTFQDDEPLLQQYVSNLCVAHGLPAAELQDEVRFPVRCQIGPDIVNVRFLAILLRIGDLLDMRCDRACPLLLNAASPLPTESYAHWTQYKNIRRDTSSAEVAIHATCQNSDEHRLLRDWCRWLYDEIKNAGVMMAQTKRHGEWRIPRISVDGNNPTISIKPAEGATYIDCDWRFEMDTGKMIDKLTHDLYRGEGRFIRELIQNGLDAMRCKMYDDLGDSAKNVESPLDISWSKRKRYCLRVDLSVNKLFPDQTTLTIEDCGTGMDREIIQRFFLQIGRSFYDTEAFRRKYSFAPTSRFGVGFLSVFSESEHVVVETLRENCSDGAIRLKLTGPRNYVLLERSARKTAGTRIEILLKNPMRKGLLTSYMKNWCKKVEFPIHINDFGKTTIICAEEHGQFEQTSADISNSGADFIIRSFPITFKGVDGDVYVLAYQKNGEEYWDRLSYAKYQYSKKHPAAAPPQLPESMYCFDGIVVDQPHAIGSWSLRLDYRDKGFSIPIHREKSSHGVGDPKVIEKLEVILKSHLAGAGPARKPEGWKYKQRLVGEFPLAEFWSREPGMIPFHVKDERNLLSLQEVKEVERFASFTKSLGISYNDDAEPARFELPGNVDAPYYLDFETFHLSAEHRMQIFTDMRADSLCWLSGGILRINWARMENNEFLLSSDSTSPVSFCDYGDASVLGFSVHKTTSNIYGYGIINLRHPIGAWLKKIHAETKKNRFVAQFKGMIQLLNTPLHHSGFRFEGFESYLKNWNVIPRLPKQLFCPGIALSEKSFTPRPFRS